MPTSIVVFDACVLFSADLRDLLVQLAMTDLFHAKWTDEIHEEWIRNLTAVPTERLQVTRRLMEEVLPMAMVNGYEEHIPTVTLPDPNDRHVVAAAIAAKASLILTWNLRHFPPSELKKFGLRRITPDEFLCDLYDKGPDLVIGSLANARRNLKKSQVSASDFIRILESQNLVQLAKSVSKHVSDL